MQGNLKGSIGRHYFAFFEIFFCVWCVCNLHMNPAPTNSSPMLLPFLPSYHLSNFRVAVRGCPSKSGYLAGRLLWGELKIGRKWLSVSEGKSKTLTDLAVSFNSWPCSLLDWALENSYFCLCHLRTHTSAEGQNRYKMAAESDWSLCAHPHEKVQFVTVKGFKFPLKSQGESCLSHLQAWI